VRHEISALQKRLGITAIHVTHDREEAMVMADRIVILNAGRIAQVGTPLEVYNRPSSSFVAAFMGAENVVPLLVEAGGERLRIAAGPVNRAASISADGRRLGGRVVEARFRSEAAELHAADRFPKDRATEDALVLDGVVVQASYPGGVWRHVVNIGEASVVLDACLACSCVEAVSVKIPAGALFLFDAADCKKGGEEPR
jgi:ABC-type Fe3+/spermidine/putrescine transport system ATPase subunit